MEFINSLLNFFSGKEFSVPLGQVIVFVTINSFCLLFGKYKLGLLISYCFVIYWGFIFNHTYFMDLLGETTWGLPVYIFSGVAMLILAVIGYFQDNKD